MENFGIPPIDVRCVEISESKCGEDEVVRSKEGDEGSEVGGTD